MQDRRSWTSTLLSAACLVVVGLTTRPLLAVDPPRDASIRLGHGTLQLDHLEPVPPALRAPVSGPGAEVVLIKFPGPVSAAQLTVLKQLAVLEQQAVLAYLGDDTFRVRVPVAEQGNLVPRLGAAWVGPWHPAYKLSSRISQVTAQDATPNHLHPVMLLGHVDLEASAVREAVATVVGAQRVVGSGSTELGPRVRALLTASEIVRWREDLARLDALAWIDVEGRIVLLNDTTTWVGQSGPDGGQATPLTDRGLRGEGQVIGLIDTGIDPDLCFFRDPVAGPVPRNECDGGTVVDPQQRKLLAVNFLWTGDCNGGINPFEWDNHDHGSHVAGTAAGDDFANPIDRDPGDGMAPAAKLVIQDGGLNLGSCADLPGLGCPVVDLKPHFQQARDQGVRIHTNSWGDQGLPGMPGIYNARSQDADLFMWQNPDFLLLFAAGNTGPGAGTVFTPSTAKNVISVGATLQGTAAESMAGFSSCGPTDDGRIKPDLTMSGFNIVSADNDGNAGTDNCSTHTLSGTSMASPALAGFAALVRQYFTEGWFPSGVPSLGDGFIPSAALIKAVMITSARSMANAAPIPSGCQGWGRVTLDDALYFPGDAQRLWVLDDTTGFASGGSETVEVAIEVPDTGVPLEIVLGWTDFPSDPSAGSHLVNDLDLTVLGPDGTLVGNVFAAGASVPGGSADRTNNVEQVRLDAPAPGIYTLQVSAFTVPMGPQPFALVVSGDFQRIEPIFRDGFESGDTTAWASANP